MHDVKLDTQLLSQSTVKMIRHAISNKIGVLSLHNNCMYRHVADLCGHLNSIVDTCNGWDRPHSPSNAAQRQTQLLDMLAWFSRWKQLHDEMVKEKRSTEYNFFADKTWFCIKSLLLAHIMVIQIHCVKNGESISPQMMNINTVEWFFGDAWQMVGGSTNKLTAAGFNQVDKKASTFNATIISLVGNNSTGANMFGRNRKY